jgi:signal transduction histidine kinase
LSTPPPAAAVAVAPSADAADSGAKVAAARARRAQLALLLCLLLLAALVLAQTWWTVAQDRRLTLASAHSTGLIAVRLLDEHATQTLRDAERRLDAVVAAIARAGQKTRLDDRAVRAVISAGQQDGRYLNALQFVNLQGLPFVNSAAYPAFQFDIVDRGYVAPLLADPAQRGSRLGHPFQRFYDQALVLPLARNLYDGAGRHLGIISIDIDVAYFAGVYARVAKDSGALVALFADQGFVVVRTPFAAGYLDLDLARSDVARRLRGAAAEGVFEDGHFLDLGGGEARQYTYRKLAAYGVNTVFAQRLDDVLADWRQRSRERVAFAAAAIGLAAVLGLFLLLHMRRLQRSERSLRDSVARQRQIEHEIRELNAGLERRVGQRTLNLEQANAELGQALRALQATQHELLRSEKLAALGSLVAGVAHELNTPIGNGIMMASSLQANAQQSLDELAAARPSRTRLEQGLQASVQGSEILLRNLVRAGELVQSFKQVAVDQASNHRRRFALSRTVEEVLATLAPMYQKSPYKMVLSLAAEVELDSYPGALGQVITNLVSNALAHGFDGRADGTMRLSTALDGDGRLLLDFADDGVGMAPPQMERVFDPFFTTKLGQGGSGLGMHIVYNLVTALLGGSIVLHSAPGQGCRVCIVLPLAAPERGAKPAEPLA